MADTAVISLKREHGTTKIIQSSKEATRLGLIEDARNKLPPGTPFEIRAELDVGPFARESMAWYYSPAFLVEFERCGVVEFEGRGLGDCDFEVNHVLGYSLGGRYIA